MKLLPGFAALVVDSPVAAAAAAMTVDKAVVVEVPVDAVQLAAIAVAEVVVEFVAVETAVADAASQVVPTDAAKAHCSAASYL